MSGGGGSGTTVQKTELDPVQRAALESVLSKSQAAFDQGPDQFFPGQTVAGVDPLTTQAQNLAVGAAGTTGDFASNQLATANRLLNLDLVGDPNTQRLADAAVKPFERRFFEEILPAISSRAVSEGAFGGARQDISESLAARDFSESALDARARVFSEANRAGIGAATSALSLAPQVAGQQLAPSQILQQVGGQRQSQEQQLIDAARERFEFGEISPDVALDQFASRVTGINLGPTTIQTSRQRGGGILGK